MNLNWGSIKTGVVKHGPVVMTGMGCLGMCATVAEVGRATVVSVRMVDTKEHEAGRKLSKAQKVECCWKNYIRAGVELVTSLGLVIGAEFVNHHNQVGLVAALAASEKKVDELTKMITGEMCPQIVSKPVQKQSESDGKGKVEAGSVEKNNDELRLFYDSKTGRYFWTTVSNVEKAVNQVNFEVARDQFVSLNDFYDLIGIDQIDEELGCSKGWRHKMLQIDYLQAVVRRQDSTPAIRLGYDIEDYD